MKFSFSHSNPKLVFVNKLLVANFMVQVLSKIFICSNNKYKDVAVATPSVSNKSDDVLKDKVNYISSSI